MVSSTPCAAARPNACCGTWRVRCSRCRRFRPIRPNRAARCQSVEGAPRLSRARRIAGRGRGQFDALPPLRVANSLAADGQTLLAGAVPGSIWLLAGSTTGPRNYLRSYALLLKFFHCGECPRRSVAVSCGLFASASVAADGPRTVYTADTQSLMEAPATGTADFVRAWVQRETTKVPITTYVQDAALPDMCMYDSKVGEVFGDRFGNDMARLKTPTDRNPGAGHSRPATGGHRSDIVPPPLRRRLDRCSRTTGDALRVSSSIDSSRARGAPTVGSWAPSAPAVS